MLDIDTLSTFLNYISQFVSLLNLHLEPELTVANINTGNFRSVYRSLGSQLRTDFVGSGAGKGPDTRVGRSSQYLGTLRGRCVIFTHAVPKERKVPLDQDFYSSSQRLSAERDRLGTFEVRHATTARQCHSVAETYSTASRKVLQQDVSEHYKRFLHRSARLYQQSMQHYIAEESNLHERALQAVRSMSNTGMGGTETKEIIADVLRGFFSVGKRRTTGSEQDVAGKCYEYNTLQTVERNLAQR